MGKKSIIIQADDAPTYKEIIDAVSRLRKDYELLSKFRGNKDKEDPESLRKVASFLEMLAKREKRNLRKSESFIDDSHDILIEMFCNEVKDMDDWELKRTMKETSLGKIFRKELFDD